MLILVAPLAAVSCYPFVGAPQALVLDVIPTESQKALEFLSGSVEWEPWLSTGYGITRCKEKGALMPLETDPRLRSGLVLSYRCSVLGFGFGRPNFAEVSSYLIVSSR